MGIVESISGGLGTVEYALFSKVFLSYSRRFPSPRRFEPMKRCPDCHRIYAEEVLLCAFDQSTLVAPEDVFVSVKGTWAGLPKISPPSAPALYLPPLTEGRLPLRWAPSPTPLAPISGAPEQRTKKKTLLLWLSSFGKK